MNFCAIVLRNGSMRLIPALVFTLGMALADGGPNHRAQQPPPIRLGVSGSNINDINAQFCCVGTLGSMVRKTVGGQQVQYILSNNHVLARSNAAPIGEAIMHRGYVDTVPVCSTTGTFHVANLSQFVPLTFGGVANNTVDAAIAQIIPGTVQANGAVMDIGAITNFPVNPAVGVAVRKSGRTTGLTTGTVSAVNVTIFVTGYGPCGMGTQIAKFINQFSVTPATFIQGGDSGSLVVRVVTLSSGQTVRLPMGLAFAGSSTATFANPINAVLTALGATFGGTAPTSEEAAAGAQAPDARVEVVSRVKDRYDDALMRLPEVVGHGVGYAQDGSGQVVIRIFFRQLTAAARVAAPTQIEGIPVELEETGEIRALGTCATCTKAAPCAAKTQ